MATATWRATSQAVSFASGKSMLDVCQNSSGTAVLSFYRMYIFNNQLSANTGALTNMRVYRSSTASTPSGGSTVTPVAHDTNNSALSANTTAGTGRTITDGDLFRQFVYSNGAGAVGGATIREWEMFVPFGEIWNAGYSDTNVQPIVARASQGAHIKQQGTQATGNADLEIEFTNA